MKSVIAVIVTYNRLVLLQEALAALKKQSYPLKHILVIDNGSTDGTESWLKNQEDVIIEKLTVNTGASGGFYYGIKNAKLYHTDWIWVMDDDTICQDGSLTALMNKVEDIDEPIGFIGSKCVWTDGSPHLMNVPAIKPSFNNQIPFNHFDKYDLILTETTSWVSLLINPKAIKEVGLPYKEFFFWSDDCEYTKRITAAGYLGFYCIDSVVVHKTPINYSPDFYRDTLPNLWKHSYGFRNEFFLQKKYNGFAYYFFWLIIKVSYTSLKILKIRKDNQFKFITVLCKSAWRSLFFNPKIDGI